MTWCGKWPNEICQFGGLTECLIYAQWLPGILYLLCASLAFYDTHENHYTMLPCTVFYLHLYTFFLITLKFLKDWLISVFISAFCSTLSEMVVSGVFLNRSLKPEVWYLSYTKILEKLRGRGKKKKDHFLRRYTYPGFHCVPESSSKHSQILFRK